MHATTRKEIAQTQILLDARLRRKASRPGTDKPLGLCHTHSSHHCDRSALALYYTVAYGRSDRTSYHQRLILSPAGALRRLRRVRRSPRATFVLFVSRRTVLQ